MWETDRVRGTTEEQFSGPDFFDLESRNEVFDRMAAYVTPSFTLTSPNDEARRVLCTQVSSAFFDVLGVAPVMGRGFRPDEARPGGPNVTVLSHRLWSTRFASDPNVVGKLIALESETHEVVGVMPPEFQYPSKATDLWTGLQVDASTTRRNAHSFFVVAKMTDGISLERANANLEAVASALEAEFAEENAGRGMWAQPIHESLVGGVQTPLLVLLGAVVLVLLTACVNIFNLLLARSVSREHEVVIRAAMGATRSALIRQHMAESLLLSLAGCALGLWLAHFGTTAFLALMPNELPRLDNVGVNATVLAFALALSLATALPFGLLPALHAGRHGLVAALSAGPRGGGSGRRNSLRNALVVAQMGLAVALVSGAGLLAHSFWNLSRVDPGFSAENVVTASVTLPSSRYPQTRPSWPQWTEVRAFQTELLDGLRATPGVRSAALAMNTPLDEGFTTRFEFEGSVPFPPDDTEEARIRVASPGYFETVGLPVLRGRPFDARDSGADAPAVVLVNESFVKRYFGSDGDDPLGRRVQYWGVSREIVGIVKDEKFLGLARESDPAIYPTFSQMPFAAFNVLVATRETPESMFGRVRDQVAAIDRELALSGFTTQEKRLDDAVAQPRFTMLLVAGFAGVALLLAAMGIHGVMSHAVQKRTKEIGVRVSFGASRRDVLALVLGEGSRLAVFGVAVGLALALVLSRAIEALLFGVGRFDPSTHAAVGVGAFLLAVAASYLPAARAAEVDPVVTLKHE